MYGQQKMVSGFTLFIESVIGNCNKCNQLNSGQYTNIFLWDDSDVAETFYYPMIENVNFVNWLERIQSLVSGL